MLERIQIIQQRFDEVSDLIIQPDIISDQKRYIQINKEYKDLKKILDRGEIYKSLMSNIDEAQEIISDGSDAEMVEMAKIQLDEAKSKLPEIEEEIKFLLIPKTLKMPKMWLLRFEQELEEMRLVFLQAIYIECIQNIANLKDGKSMLLILMKALQEDIKRLFLKCLE